MRVGEHEQSSFDAKQEPLPKQERLFKRRRLSSKTPVPAGSVPEWSKQTIDLKPEEDGGSIRASKTAVAIDNTTK